MNDSRSSETVTTLLVAVIGCIGTIIGAVLGGPIVDKWLNRNPSEPVVIHETVIVTAIPSSNQSSSGTSNDNVATPTPYGIRNPSGNIESGMPIIVDDITLVVDDTSFSTNDDEVYITIYLKNVGTRRRLFRFTLNSLTIKDDVGNVYSPIYPKNMSNICDTVSIELNSSHQLELDPEETIRIRSSGQYIESYFCNTPEYIPNYAGPISQNARKLIIVFDNFGPFNNFQVEISL